MISLKHLCVPAILLAFSAMLASAGQEQKKDDPKEEPKEDIFLSGPQKDAFMPGPCEVYNINGVAKQRLHCPVCEFGADPVVAVFAREPEEGKDAAITLLLDKMEEFTDKHSESKFHSFIVFLSPAAASSATEKKNAEPDKIDTDKLVAEQMAREALYARLKARAEKLKAVLICCTIPEGPKNYKIHDKAEVTILYYRKLKVLENFTFEEGKFTEEAATKIAEFVDKSLKDSRRKPAKVEK